MDKKKSTMWTNMKTNINNCVAAGCSVAASSFNYVQSATPNNSSLHTTTDCQSSAQKPNQTRLGNLVESTVTVEKKKELNVLFSQAMHETATPFSFFEHPSWKAFFSAFKPNWKVPSSWMI